MNAHLHLIIFFVNISMIKASKLDNTKLASKLGIGYWISSWWSKTYEQRKNDSATECGCSDSRFPDIFTASKMPIKCVCMISGYVRDEAPGGNDYTVVYNTFETVSISKVHEKLKSLSLNIRLSYMWEDTRIVAKSIRNDNEIPFIAVSPKKALNIWQPRRSCHNCENDRMSFSKISFVLNNQLSENTTLVRATLVWNVILMCNFDFSMFPFDHLTCDFRLNSRASGDVRDVLHGHEKKEIIQIPDGHGFVAYAKVVGIDKTDYNVSDQIGFNVVLKRLIEPYVWQYYFPCVAIVTISSVSFAVPLTAIPGRVSLSVILILALMNLFTGLMVGNMLINTFY